MIVPEKSGVGSKVNKKEISLKPEEYDEKKKRIESKLKITVEVKEEDFLAVDFDELLTGRMRRKRK
jgi:hypothetical protein